MTERPTIRCEGCAGDGYVPGVNPQWFRAGQPYLVNNACFLCSGTGREPADVTARKSVEGEKGDGK